MRLIRNVRNVNFQLKLLLQLSNLESCVASAQTQLNNLESAVTTSQVRLKKLESHVASVHADLNEQKIIKKTSSPELQALTRIEKNIQDISNQVDSLKVAHKKSHQDNKNKEAPDESNSVRSQAFLMFISFFVGQFIVNQAHSYLEKYIHSQYDLTEEGKIPDPDSFIEELTKIFNKALDEFETEMDKDPVSVEDLEDKISSLIKIFKDVSGLYDEYAMEALKKKNSPAVADNIASQAARLARNLENLHETFHQKFNKLLRENEKNIKNQVKNPEQKKKLTSAFDELKRQKIKPIINLNLISVTANTNKDYLDHIGSIFKPK